MTIHDAGAASTTTAPATDDLRMDEVTAHQLADELITLASSMFGLLQPHPGTSPAAGFTAEARTGSPEASPVQDPASVVSVAIPMEPVVAVAVPEGWAAPDAEEEAEATEDEFGAAPAALEVPSLDVPSLGVPSLAVPQLPEVLEVSEFADLPTAPPLLSLVDALEEPGGLDKLDQRESELDQREPESPATEARPSMTLLNEIAFLDE